MDRPGFLLNLYLFKSRDLINRKNDQDQKQRSPGPFRVTGLTDQFNVSNGIISNVMKLFIASGGVIHRFTKKKLRIATPKQDKLLLWLSKKASHLD
jgi:hypothetical protein